MTHKNSGPGGNDTIPGKANVEPVDLWHILEPARSGMREELTQANVSDEANEASIQVSLGYADLLQKLAAQRQAEGTVTTLSAEPSARVEAQGPKRSTDLKAAEIPREDARQTSSHGLLWRDALASLKEFTSSFGGVGFKAPVYSAFATIVFGALVSARLAFYEPEPIVHGGPPDSVTMRDGPTRDHSAHEIFVKNPLALCSAIEDSLAPHKTAEDSIQLTPTSSSGCSLTITTASENFNKNVDRVLGANGMKIKVTPVTRLDFREMSLMQKLGFGG